MLWLHKKEYGDKAQIHYIDTTSFKVYIKTKDIYENITKNVKERFDSWSSDKEIPLLICIMMDELGENKMKKTKKAKCSNK